MSEAQTKTQKIGFWAGLGLGLSFVVAGYLFPDLPQDFDRSQQLSPVALRLVGVTIVVGVWWVTEAIPLGATALIPGAVFPLLSIAPAKSVAPAYGSPFILLLLGGFLLALAVEKSGVHKRLALHILLRVGTSPRRLVLGFACAAAVLSMWISNTASTLIIMPIAVALVDRAQEGSREKAASFGVAVLLGTAYGASVGGMGTPVGTPPNLMAMGAIADAFPDRPELTFLNWALIAVPPVLLIIPLVWFLLTRFYPKVPASVDLGAEDVIRRDLDALGPWRPSEVRSLSVFAFTAVLWVTRAGFRMGTDFVIPGWQSLLGLEGVHDGTIALLAACLAFSLSSGEKGGEKLLTWKEGQNAPWGLVLLFGGGVALSKGFLRSGLSEFIGSRLAELAGLGHFWFVGVATIGTTFGTEVISNTALANIAMPILAATAKAAAMPPERLLVPAALACSCAFMMPAATGPNAIVFGTGRIRIGQMVKAGFFTNLLAWLVLFVVTQAVSALVF